MPSRRVPSSPSRVVSRRAAAKVAAAVALAFPLVAGALLLATAGCAEKHDKEVVVYCALDLEHAQQILDDFTKATGIHVDVHPDDEITKTVALANRIVLEKEHPKCDVFWNNEIVNTIRLQRAGCLDVYRSPNAADVPARFKDPDGHWTGFAARARVLIVNTQKCPKERLPTSYRDLVDPSRKGEGAIARPVAGTTASHLAVLFDKLGEAKAKEWWSAVKQNGCGLLSGNGPVMRSVRNGEFAFGFTDTDDFHVAWSEGAPVVSVYPDQGEGELGCLVIPNTISLVKGAPHAEYARQFVDYVLSRETERKLAFGRSAQIPVRDDVEAPPHVRRLRDLKVMDVDFAKAAAQFDAAQEWLTRPGVLDGAEPAKESEPPKQR
jgi:iron(III) transport system substrate-binding protein